MSFWNTCIHGRRTAPDGDGYALCATCGAVIDCDLKRQMVKALDAIKRDYGSYGRHTDACMHVDTDEWVCAVGCPVQAHIDRRRNPAWE